MHISKAHVVKNLPNCRPSKVFRHSHFPEILKESLTVTAIVPDEQVNEYKVDENSEK